METPMEHLSYVLYDAVARLLSRHIEPTFGSYVRASGEVGPLIPDPWGACPEKLAEGALRRRIKAEAPGDAVAFGTVTSVIATDEHGTTRRFLEMVLEHRTGSGGQVTAEYTFDEFGQVKLVGSPVMRCEVPKSHAAH